MSYCRPYSHVVKIERNSDGLGPLPPSVYLLNVVLTNEVNAVGVMHTVEYDDAAARRDAGNTGPFPRGVS